MWFRKNTCVQWACVKKRDIFSRNVISQSEVAGQLVNEKIIARPKWKSSFFCLCLLMLWNTKLLLWIIFYVKTILKLWIHLVYFGAIFYAHWWTIIIQLQWLSWYSCQDLALNIAQKQHLIFESKTRKIR